MFSNHKSSFQITNQVQNQFVFKSRTPNSLVTDPSVLIDESCHYCFKLDSGVWNECCLKYEQMISGKEMHSLITLWLVSRRPTLKNRVWGISIQESLVPPECW